MAKRQKLFKCVPLKDRSVVLSLVAFVLAIVFVTVAALLLYAGSTGPSDATIWFAALGTTIYAAFSIMAVITGEGAWLLLGLYWGAPVA